MLRVVKEGVRLTVRAQPGARRSEIVGEHGEALKIKIAAPPEDGRANAELERFLAEVLGVSKSSISIVSGLSSRNKTVLILGLDIAQIRERLRADRS